MKPRHVSLVGALVAVSLIGACGGDTTDSTDGSSATDAAGTTPDSTTEGVRPSG